MTTDIQLLNTSGVPDKLFKIYEQGIHPEPPSGSHQRTIAQKQSAPRPHQAVPLRRSQWYTPAHSDLEGINRENDKVLDNLKDEWEQYNRVVVAIKNQKNKDHKFVEGSVGYSACKIVT